MSAILILAPMLAPMASAVGIHPVHMGIIFIVNLEIGYLTPPVGMNLFVSSTLFKRSLGWVIKAVLPTLAIMMVALVIITWWPGLSLGLGEALKSDKETPAGATTPTEPPKVKSLDELMKESQGSGSADEGAGKVKSLQEIMEEAKAKESGEAEPTPSGKVKSLQELMEEAKANDAATDGKARESGEPENGAPPRVKSLQELMQEAKAKDAGGG
jgi:hypothetical protein